MKNPRLNFAVPLLLLISLTPFLTLLGQEVKNNHNLRLRIEPLDIERGVPAAFNFELQNITKHDVYLPATAPGCENSIQGTLRLSLKFTGKSDGDGTGHGCAGDTVNWPFILDRVKDWLVLAPGESFHVKARRDDLYLHEGGPGHYEFWAEYEPPYISAEDQRILDSQGIDFPREKLASAHLSFDRPLK